MFTMISFVVPVYNDPEGLRDTLESLVSQNTDIDYEILPVDNNSTDCTGEVIKEFEESYPELIRAFEEKKVQSSYAARNKGVENAKGDIICFLDADMWVKTDYLNKISSYFKENSEVDYIGCEVKIVNKSDSLIGRFDELNGFPVKNYLEEENFAPTCCLTVRKNVFDEIGLFDNRLISGGDKEFGSRVANSNHQMAYSDNIRVFHPARDSLVSMKNKYFRIGRGNFQLLSLYEDRFKSHKVEWRNLPYFWWENLTKGIFTPKESFDSTDGNEVDGVIEKLIISICLMVKEISYLAGYHYEKLRRP